MPIWCFSCTTANTVDSDHEDNIVATTKTSISRSSSKKPITTQQSTKTLPPFTALRSLPVGYSVKSIPVLGSSNLDSAPLFPVLSLHPSSYSSCNLSELQDDISFALSCLLNLPYHLCRSKYQLTNSSLSRFPENLIPNLVCGLIFTKNFKVAASIISENFKFLIDFDVLDPPTLISIIDILIDYNQSFSCRSFHLITFLCCCFQNLLTNIQSIDTQTLENLIPKFQKLISSHLFSHLSSLFLPVPSEFLLPNFWIWSDPSLIERINLIKIDWEFVDDFVGDWSLTTEELSRKRIGFVIVCLRLLIKSFLTVLPHSTTEELNLIVSKIMWACICRDKFSQFFRHFQLFLTDPDLSTDLNESVTSLSSFSTNSQSKSLVKSAKWVIRIMAFDDIFDRFKIQSFLITLIENLVVIDPHCAVRFITHHSIVKSVFLPQLKARVKRILKCLSENLKIVDQSFVENFEKERDWVKIMHSKMINDPLFIKFTNHQLNSTQSSSITTPLSLSSSIPDLSSQLSTPRFVKLSFVPLHSLHLPPLEPLLISENTEIDVENKEMITKTKEEDIIGEIKTFKKIKEIKEEKKELKVEKEQDIPPSTPVNTPLIPLPMLDFDLNSPYLMDSIDLETPIVNCEKKKDDDDDDDVIIQKEVSDEIIESSLDVSQSSDNQNDDVIESDQSKMIDCDSQEVDDWNRAHDDVDTVKIDGNFDNKLIETTPFVSSSIENTAQSPPPSPNQLSPDYQSEVGVVVSTPINQILDSKSRDSFPKLSINQLNQSKKSSQSIKTTIKARQPQPPKVFNQKSILTPQSTPSIKFDDKVNYLTGEKSMINFPHLIVSESTVDNVAPKNLTKFSTVLPRKTPIITNNRVMSSTLVETESALSKVKINDVMGVEIAQSARLEANQAILKIVDQRARIVAQSLRLNHHDFEKTRQHSNLIGHEFSQNDTSSLVSSNSSHNHSTISSPSVSSVLVSEAIELNDTVLTGDDDVEDQTCDVILSSSVDDDVSVSHFHDTSDLMRFLEPLSKLKNLKLDFEF
ncbi:hypothetical protein RCL1_004645 [Eukaryota sp. TZLM3-RCL]